MPQTQRNATWTEKNQPPGTVLWTLPFGIGTVRTNKGESPRLPDGYEWADEGVVRLISSVEYRCVSDRYDSEGGTYTLPEFIAMCMECFGEAPELIPNAAGTYNDDRGVVLRAI